MENRKKTLKQLIKKLHKGESLEIVKRQLKEKLGEVTQVEISEVEEELVQEGMSVEEITKLCDIHLAVFRESLDKQEVLAPNGHPVRILMEEHKKILEIAGNLNCISKNLISGKNLETNKGEAENFRQIRDLLKESESHYLREENVLFPFMEKHGITQPPKIMWMEHDRIREIEKQIYNILETSEEENILRFANELKEVSIVLNEMVANHFHKENKILFQAALKVISKVEWLDIRGQFDEIGYCSFTPKSTLIDLMSSKTEFKIKEIGKISLETGILTEEEVKTVFNSLPVDITFVGKDDRVKYFSQTKDRVFVRTKAIIGRKVQQCHPQKSVHIVDKILESFKKGKKESAEFWLELNGRTILIRYFPVRNQELEYLGCLEVTQDITDIKKLKGEKRLLDWK
jgi:DUF438 domain-containing protein